MSVRDIIYIIFCLLDATGLVLIYRRVSNLAVKGFCVFFLLIPLFSFQELGPRTVAGIFMSMILTPFFLIKKQQSVKPLPVGNVFLMLLAFLFFLFCTVGMMMISRGK